MTFVGNTTCEHFYIKTSPSSLNRRQLIITDSRGFLLRYGPDLRMRGKKNIIFSYFLQKNRHGIRIYSKNITPIRLNKRI